jgi:tetraspanin-15
MHQKQTVKRMFKVSFYILQAMLFVSAIAIAIMAVTIYARIHKPLKLPSRALVFTLVLSILETSSACLAYCSAVSKKRLRMLVYLTVTLLLMNLQVFLAVKSSNLHEKSFKWADTKWNEMFDEQRNFIQKEFRCCGLSSIGDRSGSSCGTATTGCMPAIAALAGKVEALVQRVLISSFFVESVGIGILALLKLRK